MLSERPEPVYEVKTASRRVERRLDKVDNEIYPEVLHSKAGGVERLPLFWCKVQRA